MDGTTTVSNISISSCISPLVIITKCSCPLKYQKLCFTHLNYKISSLCRLSDDYHFARTRSKCKFWNFRGSNVKVTIFIGGFLVNLPHWEEERTGAAILVSIGNTVVAVQVVGHLPAPIVLSWYSHSRPSVDPHVVVPDLAVAYVTGHDGVRAFVAAPDFIMGVSSLGAIRVEVPPHWGCSAVPKRVKVSPVFWGRLQTKIKEWTLSTCTCISKKHSSKSQPLDQFSRQ